MEIIYKRIGDYLLPNIILCEPPLNVQPLGKYTRIHRRFLKEHRPILYNQLLLSEKLYPLLYEVDQAANERRLRDVSEEVIIAELVYD